MLPTMRLPDPRGPLSELLFRDLAGDSGLSSRTVEQAGASARGNGVLTDEDVQIALAICYELH